VDLYLMQHGACLSEDVNPDQPLSPVGREAVARSARAAKAMGLAFELMIASPKTRARETAAIVAEAVGYPLSAVLVTEEVKALARPETTYELLRRRREARRVFIAGHLPHIPRLICASLGLRGESAVHIENAGLACLHLEDFAPSRGSLEWSLSAWQLALIR